MSKNHPILIATASLTLLTACTTSTDATKSLPLVHEQLVANVNAETLSDCVNNQLMGHGGYIFHRTYDYLDKVWYIYGEFRTMIGSGNGMYANALGFEDTDKGVSFSIRSLKSIWGSPSTDVERITNIVEQCQTAISEN